MNIYDCFRVVVLGLGHRLNSMGPEYVDLNHTCTLQWNPKPETRLLWQASGFGIQALWGGGLGKKRNTLNQNHIKPPCGWKLGKPLSQTLTWEPHLSPFQKMNPEPMIMSIENGAIAREDVHITARGGLIIQRGSSENYYDETGRDQSSAHAVKIQLGTYFFWSS